MAVTVMLTANQLLLQLFATTKRQLLIGRRKSSSLLIAWQQSSSLMIGRQQSSLFLIGWRQSLSCGTADLERLGLGWLQVGMSAPLVLPQALAGEVRTSAHRTHVVTHTWARNAHK